MFKKVLSLLLAVSMAATFTLGVSAAEQDLILDASGPDVSSEAADEAPIAADTASVSDDWIPNLTADEKSAIAAAVAKPITTESTLSEDAVYSDTINGDTFDSTNYSKDVYGFVDRMYNLVLGRDAEPEGRAYWTSNLLNSSQQGADIVYGFFTSAEYKGKNRSNEQMITDCYNAVLGRAPDSEGFTYWLERLYAGMSLIGIANGFCASDEFHALCASYGIISGSIPDDKIEARDRNLGYTRFVSRLYTNCLGRDYDTEGLNYWCNKLLNGEANGASIAGSFIFSDEYKGKHTDNVAFASMLYATLLGRAPESDGLSYWLARLNYTQSRANVMNQFIDSGEFKSICSNVGVSISGTYPYPDDSESWKMNVRLLQLINAEREPYHYLLLSDDLYSIADYRVKELPVRSAELVKAGKPVGSLDELRPNNQGDYQDVFAKYGITSTYKYELRASAANATPADIIKALMSNASFKRTILNNNLTTFGGAFRYQNSRGWYAMELAD